MQRGWGVNGELWIEVKMTAPDSKDKSLDEVPSPQSLNTALKLTASALVGQ